MADTQKHVSIFTKITNARRMFLDAGCKKTGYNSFSNYYYFELADVLPSCIRICSELGLAPIVSFTEDVATMTVYDCDDPSQSFQITSPMGVANLKGCHDVQNKGACETYNRRYLWFSLFEIVEADPIEATTGMPEDNSKSRNTASKKTKTNKNDTKTEVPSSFNRGKVWTNILIHFGWNSAVSEEDKSDIKSIAKEYLKETFNIDSGSEITELMMPEIEKLLALPIGSAPVVNNKGPEGFVGDSLDD